jgi:hypothetical protein
MRSSRRRWVNVFLMLSLAACTPSLNWRQASLEGSGVTMLFPCRPERAERAVRVADAELRMRMHSCSAAGAAFSLAFVDIAQAARVAPVMDALRSAAQANVGGTATARAWTAPGATPNEHGALLRIEGHRPDGRRVVEHVALFVRGLRVYQATALGEQIDHDALDTFFDSIRVVV